ncbi:MAG: tyrosine-type recombinase/integrase [Hyphomicrobiaceae bacterium]
MASALRTLARVVNRPPANLPCNVRSVRSLIETVAPARHGLSRGRWANIKSLVYRSLDLAGVRRLPGRSSEPPSPAWESLLTPVPYRPYRVQLLPFARHCTRQGIEPHQVDQSTFEQFAIELEEHSGRCRPREAFLDACRAWNQCGGIFEHWPAFRVQVQHRRDHYALAWTRFPPSLKADVEAMAAAAVKRFAIDDRRPIKQVSADRRVSLLRAFASALVHQGRDPNTVRSIADLVQLDAVQQGLTFLYERAGNKETVQLHQHTKLLCTLARRWVGVARDHLDALASIRRQLKPRYGMTEKNRATLRFFEDENLVAEFLSLPERLCRRYRNKHPLKVSEAATAQIGLAIGLLTDAPVRSRNAVSIRLDENLVEVGSGRHRRVHLYFPADDVKNDLELEFPLSPSTIALLDDYMKRVRPVLLRRPSQYLFPGEGDSHKGAPLLSEQIADTVEAEIGVRLTAHQFRHLAGFLYLKANPGGHEVVRRLLGHKSIETTIAFYAGMEVVEAARHYDRHIASLRARAAVPMRRRTNGRPRQHG